MPMICIGGMCRFARQDYNCDRYVCIFVHAASSMYAFGHKMFGINLNSNVKALMTPCVFGVMTDVRVVYVLGIFETKFETEGGSSCFTSSAL